MFSGETHGCRKGKWKTTLQVKNPNSNRWMKNLLVGERQTNLYPKEPMRKEQIVH